MLTKLINNILGPWLSKVLGGVALGALIFSGVLWLQLSHTKSELGSAKEVIQGLEGWQGQMVTAIGLASGSKVTTTTAQAQVQALGQSLASVKGKLDVQNKAVDQLGEEKRRAEEAAAREAKARAAAISKADSLSKDLKERAGTAAADMEAEVRRAQDTVYEAGL